MLVLSTLSSIYHTAKTRELKILEEQANEPHVAAFEAKRAELEEQQQQLMDNIRELQAAIAYETVTPLYCYWRTCWLKISLFVLAQKTDFPMFPCLWM
jgi:hypothetical protein